MGHARSLAAPITSSSPHSPASGFDKHLTHFGASPLLSGLTTLESQEILLTGRLKSYVPDEIIFSQGHAAHALYLIESGSVKLTQVSPEGSEVILWMNGHGDTIGLQAEQPASLYSCTARVVERCRAMIWDHARLVALIGIYPALRRNLNQILTTRLHELETRFREVATERVAHRLAMTLLRLRSQIGKPYEGGVQISLSREELAQMTGTTLFTISRLLSKWGEDGLITPQREAVVVLQPRGLERIGDNCFEA